MEVLMLSQAMNIDHHQLLIIMNVYNNIQQQYCVWVENSPAIIWGKLNMIGTWVLLSSKSFSWLFFFLSIRCNIFYNEVFYVMQIVSYASCLCIPWKVTYYLQSCHIMHSNEDLCTAIHFNIIWSSPTYTSNIETVDLWWSLIILAILWLIICFALFHKKQNSHYLRMPCSIWPQIFPSTSKVIVVSKFKFTFILKFMFFLFAVWHRPDHPTWVLQHGPQETQTGDKYWAAGARGTMWRRS